jgi:hypothetical protein
MKATKYLAFLFAVSSLTLQAESPHELLIVPNAKYLYSLSASPRDRTLVLIASLDQNQGEVNEGTPTIIHLDKSHRPNINTIGPLSVPWVYDSDTMPVWSNDGKIVYFDAEKGVVSYTLTDHRVETVWSGTAEGLALSRNGEYVAFWNRPEQDRNHLKLVLFDLRHKTEKQTWITANTYGGDEVGFEIAFAADDKSIYARTFDDGASSPLKRFTIGSEMPETVSENITSVVSGESAVYFVTERLDQETLVYTLMAVLDSVSRPEQLKSGLPCRSLVVSGSRRWIACKEDLSGSAILMFDSEKRTFTPFMPSHDNVVVMFDGEVIYSLNGSLLTNGSLPTTK